MNKYPDGYGILKKIGANINPRIKQEYPEEAISDELGFFN